MKRDKEKIAKLEEKGAHALALQLYDARNRIEFMSKDCLCHRRSMFDDDEHIKGLLEANKNMSLVLRQNGIIPTKYRVHYIDTACAKCRYYSEMEDECDAPAHEYAWDDHCVFDEHVISFPFYSFDAFVDGFAGIKGDFKMFQVDALDLIKVTNEDTGEVVWEAEKDNG